MGTSRGLKGWLGRKKDPPASQQPQPVVGTATAEACRFCGRKVHEHAGGTQMFTGTVDDIDAMFAAAANTADQLLTEKRTCSSCGTVFCLECGNAEGRRRGLGSTNCPGCGQKVT